MPTIEDSEFGTIAIRRSAKASQLRIRVGPDGKLRASIPLYAPLFLVRRMIKSSRDELRKLLESSYKQPVYQPWMRIGKSHTLRIVSASRLAVNRKGQDIIVSLPATMKLHDALVTEEITLVVRQALRAEAKSYLPKRLKYLAEKNGFHYESVRFSHAGSRWGSCSSKGTISLNIALMQLPFELIDYVLLHELAHTKQMNHSSQFWSIVESVDPDYIAHRRALKSESPSI